MNSKIKSSQEPTLKLIETSKKMGFKINKDKTKYLVMSRRMTNKQNIDISQYSFEQVNNFKYLGVNINANKKMYNKINLWIFC